MEAPEEKRHACGAQLEPPDDSKAFIEWLTKACSVCGTAPIENGNCWNERLQIAKRAIARLTGDDDYAADASLPHISSARRSRTVQR